MRRHEIEPMDNRLLIDIPAIEGEFYQFSNQVNRPLNKNKFPVILFRCSLFLQKETILHKKSGFLYKFDDPRELAKSLNTVIQLTQEELISMGNEGRKNITKKFDVETMCDTNLHEYKKLLKN